MRIQDIPWHPTDRTLRQFGMLCIIIFGMLAGWRYFKGEADVWFIACAAMAFAGVVGTALPQFIRPLFVGWMVLAFPIGWLVSHVLFAIIFFGIFWPLGLLLRLKGHDPLKLKKPTGDTYWTDKPVQDDLRRYLKQF